MKGERMVRTLRPVVVLVAAIWAVELANQLVGHRLNLWLGLKPRAADGLIGVLAMPFLHAGITHAFANTLPLVFLGTLGMLVAPRRFWRATVLIVLASGLAVWLLGRPNSIHIGASGLIFGWFGFLVGLGFVERSGRALAGALLVMVVYGGMIGGVLPRVGTTSWEAHLFGASGLIFGWFGFLVGLGFVERSGRALAGALLVMIVYGGMIGGVLPRVGTTSWEAHLFGALAGAGAAWFGRPRRRRA